MKKHPLEYLNETQLDELLNYNAQPFDNENKNNIHQKFAAKKIGVQKRNKRRKRWLVSVATASFALLLVGFTFRDDLSLAYKKRFGNETELLLLNSDKLSQTVTDQGLELKAVASFKDGSNQYLVSQLTDLTGERLDKDTIIDRWEMFGGGNTQMTHYDASTKTATLLTSAIGATDTPRSGFQLTAFVSGKKDFTTTYHPDWQKLLQSKKSWIDLTNQKAQGGGLNEEVAKNYGINWNELIKTGLKPLQANAELDHSFTISNIAYRDDLLHLQLKIPNTPKMAAVFPYLVINNKKITSFADFSVDYGTHNNKTGRPDYQEYIFPVKKADLMQAKLVLDGWQWKTYQEGDWTIQLKKTKELPLTKLPPQIIKNQQEKVKLDNIKLSPIALDFSYSGKLNGTKITLNYQDGTKFTTTIEYADQRDNHKSENYRYEFGLKDNKEIKSITFNQQELKLTH